MCQDSTLNREIQVNERIRGLILDNCRCMMHDVQMAKILEKCDMSINLYVPLNNPNQCRNLISKFFLFIL